MPIYLTANKRFNNLHKTICIKPSDGVTHVREKDKVEMKINSPLTIQQNLMMYFKTKCRELS